MPIGEKYIEKSKPRYSAHAYLAERSTGTSLDQLDDEQICIANTESNPRSLASDTKVIVESALSFIHCEGESSYIREREVGRKFLPVLAVAAVAPLQDDQTLRHYNPLSNNFQQYKVPISS